jgi:hypothetical protein
MIWVGRIPLKYNFTIKRIIGFSNKITQANKILNLYILQTPIIKVLVEL